MNYRSVSDLAKTIRSNLHLLPKDIELVVGIPRSGMLAASMIGLMRNVKVTDLSGYLENVPLRAGRTRIEKCAHVERPANANVVLFVDDSMDTGESLGELRSLLSTCSGDQQTYFCVVYGPERRHDTDTIVLETIQQPRLFEWNLMHRPFLSRCCLDIDGVICRNPLPEENDDGPAYRSFLNSVQPTVVPTYTIGHLVTSRLEKYRGDTEQWLRKHGFTFGVLHMLSLQDAETRRRLGCHAAYKADVYRRMTDTALFIESDAQQAENICRLSGKPALCYETQQLFSPGVSYKFASESARSIVRRITAKLARIAKNRAWA